MNTPAPFSPEEPTGHTDVLARPDRVQMPARRSEYAGLYVLPTLPKETRSTVPTDVDAVDDQIIALIDARIAERKGVIHTALGDFLTTETGVLRARTPQTPQISPETKSPLETATQRIAAKIPGLLADLKTMQVTEGYRHMFTNLQAVFGELTLSPDDTEVVKGNITKLLIEGGVCDYACDALAPWKVGGENPETYIRTIESLGETLPPLFSENPERPSQKIRPRRRNTVAHATPPAPVTKRNTEPLDPEATLPVGITALRDFTASPGVQEHARVSVTTDAPLPTPSVNEVPVFVALEPTAPAAPQVEVAVEPRVDPIFSTSELAAMVEARIDAITAPDERPETESTVSAESTETSVTDMLTPRMPQGADAETRVRKPIDPLFFAPTTALRPEVLRNVRRYGPLVAGILATLMSVNPQAELTNDPNGTVLPIVTPAMASLSRPNFTQVVAQAAKTGVTSAVSAIKNAFTKPVAAQELSEYEKKYLSLHQQRVESAQQKAAQWKAGDRVKEFTLMTPLATAVPEQTDDEVSGEAALTRLFSKKDVMLTMGENINPAINLYRTPTSAAKEQPKPKSLLGKLGSKIKSLFA